MDLTEQEKVEIRAMVNGWFSRPTKQQRHKEQAEARALAGDSLLKSKAHDQPRLSRGKLLAAICTDDNILMTTILLVAACGIAFEYA